ncbi:hypothetical protein INT45_004984 [Circinella minor]|uniref:Uncharacterized protein n=1 Tax=Circinella minor TaxID=1195481 RepID=A0A8H7S8R3_9FUNG|nr:hypothetical protein INT45_004984 [Circinella minor]
MTSQNSIFRQQQQLYKSSHYFGKPKSPTFYSTPISPSQQEDLPSKGRKRRASEDELMEDTSVDDSIGRLQVMPPPRTPLDKGKLIELISDLVEANPRLQPEINDMIQPHQPQHSHQLLQQPYEPHNPHQHQEQQQNK